MQVAIEAEHCLSIVMSEYDSFRCLSVSYSISYLVFILVI